MATVTAKLRLSPVKDRPGSLYYQIIHRRIIRQIASGIRLPSCCWDAGSGTVNPAHENADALQNRIDTDLEILRDLIRQADRKGAPYSAGDIVRQFRSSSCRLCILAFMQRQIDSLRECHRLGTAQNYERARHSFAAFLGQDIPATAVTERVIDRYNLYLMRRGVVRNTISFYMRILRSVYHKAVGSRTAKADSPFRNVYTGIDHTRKRAVDSRIIARLGQLDLCGSRSLSLARDLFLFSFYTRGMAFVDMVYLKPGNIRDGMIRYTRRKTGQPLCVRIEPSMQSILDRYGSAGRPYLFPVLLDEDPVRTFCRYQNALTYYNRLLKKLSGLLGLETSLSSYSARHTWATAARNLNVPISVISAGMGHTSEKTTRIYLSSFESGVIDSANRLVINNL